jgi:predicted DCC family thiol-disulfide oxidoreductase YuxK
MKPDHVLLYDADCGFCRWTLDKILARDKDHRIRAVPLQSAEASALLDGMDEETKMSSWHLVLPNGTVRSAGDGVAPLFRLLPRGGAFASIASTAPPLTRSFYRFIARNRTTFGKMLGTKACAVDPSRRTEVENEL